jgi:hypothetical protein
MNRIHHQNIIIFIYGQAVRSVYPIYTDVNEGHQTIAQSLAQWALELLPSANESVFAMKNSCKVRLTAFAVNGMAAKCNVGGSKTTQRRQGGAVVERRWGTTTALLDRTWLGITYECESICSGFPPGALPLTFLVVAVGSRHIGISG